MDDGPVALGCFAEGVSVTSVIGDVTIVSEVNRVPVEACVLFVCADVMGSSLGV